MRRRRFLALAGATGAGGLAGCTGLFQTRPAYAPPLVKDRPDAVYYPTHVEQMEMAGVKRKAGYACALTYTYPHRFWLVTGTHTKEVAIKSADTMHVMPVVWDVVTGRVLPDVNPKLTVTQDGGSVLSDSPWTMLSQPMGFHYGDNVHLPGDGRYDVTVHVGAPAAKRTGSLADAPESVSFEFTLEYTESRLNEIPWHKLPEKKGTRGAVSHMDMEMLPASAVPTEADLPGSVLGSGRSGDADVVVTVLDDASRFGGGSSKSYLAVSPRSPYNRYLLPMMGLSATVDGETRDLTQTLDPDLGLHYGTAVGEAPGTVTVHVDAPPQFARHEGYETAFLDMSDVTVRG